MNCNAWVIVHMYLFIHWFFLVEPPPVCLFFMHCKYLDVRINYWIELDWIWSSQKVGEVYSTDDELWQQEVLVVIGDN